MTYINSPINPYIKITKTDKDDPAYLLLTDPNIYSIPNQDIFKKTCYICVDPEFADMGMSLCYACYNCGGHVAADNVICDDCGADQQEHYENTH